NDTEDPHQCVHTDEEWNGDEEPRDKAASQPLCQSHPAPIASRMSAPAMMRYQAKGAKPLRATYRTKGFTTTRAARNAITNPIAISAPRSGASWCLTFHKSCRNAPASAGIARKNENSAAAARSSPASRPPIIVAPDRDTPGT